MVKDFSVKLLLRRKPLQAELLFTSKPVLGHFDENAPKEIHIDACGYGIGLIFEWRFKWERKDNLLRISHLNESRA
ncbi:hypothetical protein LAZ67_5003826 [Cordylochernes scorpioides]|uniref:Uncharacterized protein n=1 Tax=Cordylochernes scorpioides TaxID=51811 RepID=A0ABY6KKI0_9ARAC|nr:hypothetical protein LAZ67_5003826 [Cordylochernes scorpioides]